MDGFHRLDSAETAFSLFGGGGGEVRWCSGPGPGPAVQGYQTYSRVGPRSK